MKCIWFTALCCMVVVFGVFDAAASYMVLEGGPGVTTGELFEGVADAWATNQVVESAGLQIRARTTDSNQSLNANNGYFGINSDLPGEDLQAFDVGEMMEVSFDRDIRINLLDFNLFDAGEVFSVGVGGQDPIDIPYDSLFNKSSDIYTFATPLEVPAGTIIEFYSSSGSIGLDGIDLDVIPEPTTLALIGMFGVGVLTIRRLKK